jgi:hypothetical protein
MNRTSLLCFAHGRDDNWEAICVDFDIAVHASSEKEVRRLLEDAIRTYVEDVNAEDAPDRERLFNRRAPLWVRFSYAAGYMLHILRRKRQNEEMQASFDVPVPCPA